MSSCWKELNSCWKNQKEESDAVDPMEDEASEVAHKLVEEILSNFERNLINNNVDRCADLVWALWNLTQTDDEENIQIGMMEALKFYRIAPPIIQANFLYHVNCLSSFTLTAILCSTAVRHGIPFPGHLLSENSFNINYKTPMCQHIMGLGTNSTYNLGITSTQEVKEPRLIQLPENARKVQMSATHTLFLTNEGNVYGCGQGSGGQLGSKNKCLVVTPSLVFQGGEDNTVLDIAVDNGWSAFITDKKVYISGKYGSLSAKDDFFVFRLEKADKFVSMTVVEGELRAYGHHWFYICSQQNGHFREVPIYHSNVGIPQTSFGQKKKTSKESAHKFAVMELCPNDELDACPYTITVKYNADSYKLRDYNKYDCSSMLCAKFRSEPKTERIQLLCHGDNIRIEEVLFSVNGLIVDLFIYSFSMAHDGQVRLVATAGEMKSRVLYGGQAKLVAAWHDSNFQFSTGKKHGKGPKKNYNLLFVLEEFPNSHGITSVEMSPDGKNMIYIIDKDPFFVNKIHNELHEMRYTPGYDYKELGDSIINRVVAEDTQKAVLDIHRLNKDKKEYMDPIPMDIYVPHSLDPFYMEIRKPNARLDFLKGLYPEIENYIKDGTVTLNKNDRTAVRPTVRDFLLLAFFNGHDVIPPECIKLLYAEMFQSNYKKAKWDVFKIPNTDEDKNFTANFEDYSRQKQFFAEFLAGYLGDVGLRAQEILPDKYLLRSIFGDFFLDYLTTNMAVTTADGHRFPYNWEILCLQSDYFGAALFHSTGDTELNIDYPKEIVSSALRIFIEPNHLYDMVFEDLFDLLDLFDRHLCMAAIHDTLVVVFEQVTEATVYLLFDFWERMEHLRDQLNDHFMDNLHMILFWRNPHRPPLGLLKELEELIEAGSGTVQLPENRLAVKNPFKEGVVFSRYVFHAMSTEPAGMQELIESETANWSKLSFLDVCGQLSGGFLDPNRFRTLYERDFLRIQQDFPGPQHDLCVVQVSTDRRPPEYCKNWLMQKKWKFHKADRSAEAARRKKNRVKPISQEKKKPSKAVQVEETRDKIADRLVRELAHYEQTQQRLCRTMAMMDGDPSHHDRQQNLLRVVTHHKERTRRDLAHHNPIEMLRVDLGMRALDSDILVEPERADFVRYMEQLAEPNPRQNGQELGQEMPDRPEMEHEVQHREEVWENAPENGTPAVEQDIPAVEEQIEIFEKSPSGSAKNSPSLRSAEGEKKMEKDFPGMSSSSSSTPKSPKEKLIFPKRSKFRAPAVPVTPKAPAPAPWLTASTSASSSKSFKEIQEEEAAEVARNKAQNVTSNPIPVAVQPRSRKNTWQESPAGPSSASPGSFAAIMAEEERKQHPEKKKVKPLEAVAMEERAMQELAEMYTVQFNGEAVINVSLAEKNV